MRRPLQVYLEEADVVRLQRWCTERNVTKSQVVRAAVRAFIRPAGQDPLLDLSGAFAELPRDASARFDQYLEESYVAERPARYGRRRRGSAAAVRR